MLHHHYFDRNFKEYVCFECQNATDYCLYDYVTIGSAAGERMENDKNGSN